MTDTTPGHFADETPSLKRNLAVLVTAQLLGAASGPIVIALGGLVGQQLSSDPALATLPVSMYNLGLALGTLPAAFIMRRFGRRSGYLLGATIGVLSGLIAAGAITLGAFVLFCCGTFAAGLYAAYVQTYRFGAADARTGPDRARAISWVMVGGLVAAVIGPQLVIATREAVPGIAYAGSSLGQAGLALITLPVLSLLHAPRLVAARTASEGGRSVLQLLASSAFLLAWRRASCPTGSWRS